MWAPALFPSVILRGAERSRRIFWGILADRAIPGVNPAASINPKLAGPCQVAHAIPGAALLASPTPSLDILSSRSALKKLCFLSAAPNGCLHSGGLCLPSLAQLLDFDSPQTCPPWQVLRPSKSCAFRRLRRTGACILVDCACHPWRNCSTSIHPKLALHGKSCGPRKAALFVGCAERASPTSGLAVFSVV